MTTASSDPAGGRDPAPGADGGDDPGDGPVVGLLVCDHVTGDELVAAAGGRDYPAMYGQLLRGAEPGLRFRVYDVVGGQLPTDPGECDAWLITGARYDAYGHEPWITALRRFVVSLRDRRARTVGVCFGHQAIAHALGGRAEPAGHWKAGPQPLTAETTPWFEGATVTIHAMHQDVVTVLPAGARTIGAGPTAEHPLFLVDESMLGIQDHPEYDRRYIAGLVEARRGRMGDTAADDALARVATVGTDNEVVGRWLVDFLLDRRRRSGPSPTDP